MATKIAVFLPVISIIISLLLSSQSCAATANEKGKSLITETCSHTEFPDVCTSTLESDPRSFNADVTGLSRIGLELVFTKGKETTDVAHKLVNSATNYEMWANRAACFNGYNMSIYRVKEEGLQNFDAKNYKKAYQVLHEANAEIIYCNTLKVPELTERNTIISRFITDLKTILHLRF